MSQERHEDRIAEILEELHEESLEAIRGVRPVLYGDVSDTYAETLLAIPLAWARYGQRFTAEVAQGLDWVSEAPLRQVSRNLYTEIAEAVRGHSSEMAHEAIGLPYTVALRAVPLGAHALAQSMLDLLVGAYTVSRTALDTEIGDLSAEWAARFITEFGSFAMESRLTDEKLSIEQRREAALFIEEAYGSINSLLKEMLEAGDLSKLAEIDDRWSLALETWNPEHASPRGFEVERLADQLGAEDPRIAEAEALARINDELASTKTRLLSLRTAYRFGLCYWALRKLRVLTPDEMAGWLPIFEHFASHFSTPEQAAAGADEALRLEWSSARGPWTHWVVSELPEGRAHSIGVDISFLETFLVLALIRINPETSQAPLPGLPWMRTYRDELERLLNGLVEEGAIQRLIEPDQLSARAERLRELISDAARRRQELEDEELRDTDVSAERTEKFMSALKDNWLKHRIAPVLFRWVEAYSRDEAPDGEEGWFGMDRLLPKDLFVDESRVVGGDMVAADLGRALAHGEMDRLCTEIAEAVEIEGEGETRTFAESVRSCIARQEEASYSVRLILTPVSWRIHRDMGLPERFAPRPNLPTGLDLPSESLHWYAGVLEEAAVIDWPAVPNDRIYFADLEAFGLWRQYPVSPEGEEVLVEIRTYDQAGAVELAQRDQELFRTPERESVEARAAEIRKHVLLHVRTRFVLEKKDTMAVRFLRIPEDLQD